MPRDYLDQAPSAVRRADRAVTDDAWIEAYLQRAAWGTLATVHDGQPFLNSNLFWFDPARRAVYVHTANVGRLAANVQVAEAGVPGTFGAFGMGRLLPADEALEFSVEYHGVTAFGRVHAVPEAAEAEAALQSLLDKYAPHLRPGEDYRPITAGELKRTAVWRLDIAEWTGKRKQAPADFPGAFVYAVPEDASGAWGDSELLP